MIDLIIAKAVLAAQSLRLVVFQLLADFLQHLWDHAVCAEYAARDDVYHAERDVVVAASLHVQDLRAKQGAAVDALRKQLEQAEEQARVLAQPKFIKQFFKH